MPEYPRGPQFARPQAAGFGPGRAGAGASRRCQMSDALMVAGGLLRKGYSGVKSGD